MSDYKFFVRQTLNEQKRIIEIVSGSFDNNGSEIIDEVIEIVKDDWTNMSSKQWQKLIPQIKAKIRAMDQLAESRGGVFVDDDATIQ